MSAQERPGAPNSAQERPRVPRSAQESSVGRRVGEASLRATWAAVAPFTWGGGGARIWGRGSTGEFVDACWKVGVRIQMPKSQSDYKCLSLKGVEVIGNTSA